VYDAVKLHVRMHAWERALALAQRLGRHADTVLMYRAAHLRRSRGTEGLEALRAAAAAAGPLDEAALRARNREEKAREIAAAAAAARGGRAAGGRALA
jgi:hypothetical protein